MWLPVPTLEDTVSVFPVSSSTKKILSSQQYNNSLFHSRQDKFSSLRPFSNDSAHLLNTVHSDANDSGFHASILPIGFDAKDSIGVVVMERVVEISGEEEKELSGARV